MSIVQRPLLPPQDPDDDDPVEVFRRLVQAVEKNDLRGVKTLTRELRCLGWGCTLLATKGGDPR